MEKMGSSEIQSALVLLPEWKLLEKREAIFRTFSFQNFVEAFGWMEKIARIAEEMNHHPEWLNIYNRVEVTLMTHDAKGLTEKDILLAKAMDDLFREGLKKG